MTITEFYKQNGFLVDFEDTEETRERMDIEYSDDWYDEYTDELYDFADKKKLKKITFGNGERMYSDIYYSKDVEKVIADFKRRAKKFNSYINDVVDYTDDEINAMMVIK